MPPSSYPPNTLAAFNGSAAATYLGILSCPSLPVESSANAPPNKKVEDVAAHAEQCSRRELAVPVHPKIDIVHAVHGRISACISVAAFFTSPTVPHALISTC